MSGTDTSTDVLSEAEELFGGIRRLTAIADSAGDHEAIYRALARELLASPGGEEVHVHHLAPHADELEELVVVYLYDGEGRLSYLVPRGERAPGVSWVASTHRSFLASRSEEFAATVPRLEQTGPVSCALLVPLSDRGEVHAVVILVRRSSGVLATAAVEHAVALVEQAATALALVRARAEAGTDAVSGSMNHRAMRRRLQEEIDRALRTGGAALLPADRPRRLQVGQRRPRPPGRRRAAARGRAGARWVSSAPSTASPATAAMSSW